MTNKVLTHDEAQKLNKFWRACNYLAAGMIYLRDNPLLEEPLTKEQIKERLLGHWGSAPGLSFIYTHCNRAILKHDVEMIYLAGPGHGAPGVIAPVYLEGSYTEKYPDITQDKAGMQTLFKKFSFPGGLGSHCTPELPGSIHEGGELGYSVSHAYGAAFDHPNLIVTAVVGDGESETGPLATAWHSNKFLNPITDGAVLPILHLNGYKINNPSILSRVSHEELENLFKGYGYTPFFVEGSDPMEMHEKMAKVMDECIAMIKDIQHKARVEGNLDRPFWPMIVLRSPKGWTGPVEYNGKKIENFWRSHQVPITLDAKDPQHSIDAIESWLRSYGHEELFDANGHLVAELHDLMPKGDKRMSAHPVTNGGYDENRTLDLPDYRDYGVKDVVPAITRKENTYPLGEFMRDIMKRNMKSFRVFGPDENTSNKLHAVYDVSEKCFWGDILPIDADGTHLNRNGRVMEMLSEHTLEGWMEAYTLTGRHGLLSTYESFAHVIDSMVNQHCKWLDMLNNEPWRRKVPSLNLLMTSTVWRQDHNGFTHQDPGFVDIVVNKKSSVTRVYFPADANTLLSMADHCFRSQNYVNVIVSDKQNHAQFVPIEKATQYCAEGVSIWDWASCEGEPDLVICGCGDIVTYEALAAVDLLHKLTPELKVRFVNVIDLFRLSTEDKHGHGLSDNDFIRIFTADKPVIFNFHGYPYLIKRMISDRSNNLNFSVHGYQEQGSINTPLELAIQNGVDRFTVAIDALTQVSTSKTEYINVINKLKQRRLVCQDYAYEHGVDLPEETSWKWPHKQ